MPSFSTHQSSLAGWIGRSVPQAPTVWRFIISPLQSTAGHRSLRLIASHPVSRPAQIVTPPGRRALQLIYSLALHLSRRGLHSRTRLSQRLSVLRLIWPALFHFSKLIRCAMSVTIVLCRITSGEIITGHNNEFLERQYKMRCMWTDV
jgi:hypothetical protein